ncbi:hypothetical protein PIB30_054162 [Stylosanthes scabra]|uniref:Uncharacterized protein n=1 Tax=Stylosanthes scabra TaxID=79078 RepID=A0ABU6SJS3_9FABA|nr:hypothetical protein [Stylosanthes scabra]
MPLQRCLSLTVVETTSVAEQIEPSSTHLQLGRSAMAADMKGEARIRKRNAFVKMSATCSEDRVVGKLGEDGGVSAILGFGGAPADGGLLRAFPGDEVATEVNAESGGRSPVI